MVRDQLQLRKWEKAAPTLSLFDDRDEGEEDADLMDTGLHDMLVAAASGNLESYLKADGARKLREREERRELRERRQLVGTYTAAVAAVAAAIVGLLTLLRS